ncbi:MAG: GNAT family N-acetyltransferase [Pseudomonadales bacterium]
MTSSTVPFADIKTPRLRLQPMQAVAHAELLTLWHNAQVRRYLWDNTLVTQQQVQAVQQASDACFARWGCGMYTLTLVSGAHSLAGFCGIRDFEDSGVPELLYGIHPDHWGQGLVSEATRALLEFVFTGCGVARVVAATDTPNQSSVKVMQRLGMAFEERKLWHGLDTVFYSLNGDDFVGS